MFTVCTNCGEYHPEKELDFDDSYLVCRCCGHKRLFHRLPLFVITGASGTGKSTLLNELLSLDEKPDLVYLESDMLWRKEFCECGTQEYRDLWLYVCCNISQSKRPVVLFGSASPSEFEGSQLRKCFAKIHYLVLTCEKSILENRLVNRSKWRKSSSPEKVREHLEWNQSFIDNASTAVPKYAILDTSHKMLKRCAKEFVEWVNNLLLE